MVKSLFSQEVQTGPDFSVIFDLLYMLPHILSDHKTD